MDQRPTVFLIDDDVGVRNSIAYLIREIGWDVEIFASAESFLDSCSIQRPGYLVVDLHLPGMNGVELQEHLRARDHTLPAILITACADDPAALRARRSGLCPILPKPFRQHELLHLLDGMHVSR